MTGNLSRAVLRGAGARESACLPDLTKVVYHSHAKKQKKLPPQVVFSVFRCYAIRLYGLMPQGVQGTLSSLLNLQVKNFILDIYH